MSAGRLTLLSFVTSVAAILSCAPPRQPATPAAAPADVGARRSAAAPPVPGPTREPASLRLELVAFHVVPQGAAFDAIGDALLGGLSSCATAGDGTWLAVSDSREIPIFFTFGVELGMGGLRIDPTRATRLAAPVGAPGEPAMLDLEGLTVVDDTRLIVSSEGDAPHHPPGVFEYDLSGRFVRSLPVPETFLPDAVDRQSRGVRDNLAFEPLTHLPDGRLFTASEGPLLQDDDLPGWGRGAWGRVLEYVRDGDSWRPGREFAYPIDPVPAAPPMTDPFMVSGLVELLPLDDERFLAMERSFVGERLPEGKTQNGIRIYEVAMAGADDVSALPSLREATAFAGLEKRLVLDLAEMAPQLGPRLRALENFEGMCHGPALPDGTRSLLIVADDNFNPRQRTVFVLLRVVPR